MTEKLRDIWARVRNSYIAFTVFQEKKTEKISERQWQKEYSLGNYGPLLGVKGCFSTGGTGDGSCVCFNYQSDDPAVKWQLNLYKDVLKSEEPSDPEKTVERVQRISAAVFHLEQVRSICPEYWGRETILENTKLLSSLSS